MNKDRIPYLFIIHHSAFSIMFMAMPIPALVERARERLSRVTGLQPSSTLGVTKESDAWRVSVEMIEKKSVPDGMDVLAIYEILLDEDGNMLEFSRKKLRRRMDTDEDLIVEAEPMPFQPVVMNLAVYAREARPEGSRLRIKAAQVELEAQFCQAHPDLPPGRSGRLSVGDSGREIPPEIHSRRFHPVDTTEEVPRLRIAESEITERGKISEIRNPESKIRDLNPRPTIRNPQSAIRNRQGGTETILLVEDEPMVLALGQTVLEHFGYRVLTARDGEQAIGVYHEYQGEIRLVILDVVMPKLGGRETFRHLKRLDPTVKVLLATEGSLPESAEDLLQEGLCGVVRKPYHIHELAQVVRAAIESASRVARAATAL